MTGSDAQPGPGGPPESDFDWAVRVSLRKARRVVVGVIGATLLATGAALLVLPGPGLVVAGIGLAVLASEFVWARRWLGRIKALVRSEQAATDAGPRTPGTDSPRTPGADAGAAQGLAGGRDRRGGQEV